MIVEMQYLSTRTTVLKTTVVQKSGSYGLLGMTAHSVAASGNKSARTTALSSRGSAMHGGISAHRNEERDDESHNGTCYDVGCGSSWPSWRPIMTQARHTDVRTDDIMKRENARRIS